MDAVGHEYIGMLRHCLGSGHVAEKPVEGLPICPVEEDRPPVYATHDHMQRITGNQDPGVSGAIRALAQAGSNAASLVEKVVCPRFVPGLPYDQDANGTGTTVQFATPSTVPGTTLLASDFPIASSSRRLNFGSSSARCGGWP